MIKILLVEDVPTDAELIAKSLGQGHILFDLLRVDTRESFVDALNRFMPDIILADHTLPSFDSHEALDILQSRDLKIPFLLITGNISEEFSVGVLKRGADDYILKDRLERLPKAVSNLLEKARLEKERQLYLDDLKWREQRSQALVENIADVVAIIDCEGLITYCSPALTSVLGYREEEALKLNILTIINPEDRAILSHRIAQPELDVRIPRAIQRIRLLHQDGSWKIIEGTITNMCSEPRVEGFILTFRDVTEQLQAEAFRKETESQYQALFENSIDAILLTEKNGRILAANPGACQLFQMTEQEICEGGREAIVDLTDPRLIPMLKQRELDGKVRGELTFKRKDGSRFPGEISSRVYTTAAGLERTSMVIRDITERKLAELELRTKEENYRLLFHFSPVPKWIFAVESLAIVDVNQTAINLYGYSRNEFLNLTLRDLRFGSEYKRLDEALADAQKREGVVKLGLVTHKRKDDSLIKVEVSCYQLTYQGLDCMLAAAVDVTDRENALSKLQLNEKRLLSAQKIATMGYWQLDLKNSSLYWSDEVYNIWEIAKSDTDLDLYAVAEHVHSEDRPMFLGQHLALADSKEEFEMEYRLILPEGKIKWIHDKWEVIRNSENSPITLEGTVQDITTKRLVLQELAISEARHRGIINSQTNYLIRTDLEGKYSYYNGSFLRDFGWMYPDGNILGTHSMSSIMPYHHQLVIETVTKCFGSTNSIFQIEIDKPREGGGVRTTLWDFICLTDTDGSPKEIQCSGIDISARIAAEAALKESLTRYDYVAKATTDAIWDWDLVYDSLYWSEAIKNVFGHNISILSDTSSFWSEHIHPDESGRIHDSIKSAIRGEQTRWEEECRFRKSDGKYAYVRIRGFLIRNENGKATRMVGSMADITDIKQSEIQLKELNEQLKSFMTEVMATNRELEQFSYIVSHNLRAPVANIIGLTELLTAEELTLEEKAGMVPQIVSAGRRLDEIISDLNIILQIKGRVNEFKTKLRLSDIISSVKQDLQEKIVDSGARLIVDLEQGDEIYSIRNYLHSIFYNLISNSIKYARPDVTPEIRISSYINEGQIMIICADNGLGINLQKKGEHVFGLYKRFHDHVEGKGLGLFMVKTQTEALGGRITVDSEIGKGTTFKLELPVSDTETELIH